MMDAIDLVTLKLGLEFEVLQERIHAAKSRVDMLAEKTPAGFVAFDLLALGDESFLDRPFDERRAAMAEALAAGFGKENIRKQLQRGLVFETGFAPPAIDIIEPATRPASCTAGAGSAVSC